MAQSQSFVYSRKIAGFECAFLKITALSKGSKITDISPCKMAIFSELKGAKKKEGGAVLPTRRNGVHRLMAVFFLSVFTLSAQHGYIKKPAIRAYLCQLHTNPHCGSVQYEPQSVEAPKGFPKFGPPDQHIAGGGIFPELDDTGRSRWRRIQLDDCLLPLNRTHLRLPIEWVYTAAHATSGYHLFGTVRGFDGSKPLRRSKLRFIHSVPSRLHRAYVNYTHIVAKKKLHALGTLLAIWDIADTANAFYQVIDYRYRSNKKRRQH